MTEIGALTADDIFLPGADPGLAFFTTPDPVPQRLTGGPAVEALCLASDWPQRLSAVEHMLRQRRQRSFPDGLRFCTLPAVATDLRIAQGIVTLGGKALFTGAAGLRLLTRLGRLPAADRAQPFEQLLSGIGARARANPLDFAQAPPADRALDLVIPARNLFNYFHFTTETLPALSLVSRHGLTGRIVIHSHKPEEAGFLRDQIARLYPELAGRVVLSHGVFEAARALIPFDTTFLYHLARDPRLGTIDRMVPASPDWMPRRMAERSVKTLLMNRCEGALADLRADVLARLGPVAGGRRLYVTRRPGRRDRAVVGGTALQAMLTDLGFETLDFEDLDALGQARAMAGAAIVVAGHGAGLANMLFCPPDALVVELSTLQTLQARLGDFNGVALASGARHLHLVVDHDWPDPAAVPDIDRDGHVGQRLGPEQIAILRARLLAEIDPVAQAKRLARLQALNDARDFPALQAALAEGADFLRHLPEAQVWAANAAQARGDAPAVLAHLVQAMALAPRRAGLVQRTLLAAHRARDRDLFGRAALALFRADPAGAAALFAQRGWDARAFRPAGAED
ncbi:glycosyltransferase family 61 protein [Frigidibacter sp. MR17.14]|uniref:glycosyltransferase family 61 protein n=1 Tax=Frigidibacter sp. MR17.14 TaxID=3126509 RepID=UPI003012D6D8